MADYVRPSSAAADCSADFVLPKLSMKRQSTYALEFDHWHPRRDQPLAKLRFPGSGVTDAG